MLPTVPIFGFGLILEHRLSTSPAYAQHRRSTNLTAVMGKTVMFRDAKRAGTVIGRAVTRLEDETLLRGKGRFADDLSFPGQLHMRVVRSGHAHGRIVSIDATEARALPGVVAIWTADDIASLGPIDFRDP